jgi:hypothetical protein
MNSPEAHPSKFSNMRRSQRVFLSVPIIVFKGEAGKNQTSEETRTLIVSAHGALLALKLPVQPGELLTVKHKKTEEELLCRVVNNGPEQAGKSEVAVEFERPAPRFWRIAFPPADWNPRSPDAKPPTPRPPGWKPPQPKLPAFPAEPQKKQANKSPEPAAH